MTKHFCILCMMIFCCAGTFYGQTDFSYSYDNNGNRYQRQVVTLKSSVEYDSTQIENGESVVISDIVVTVFPNPVKGELNVVSSESIDAGTLYIYDMAGRSVLAQDFSGEKTAVDLNNQTAGQYILVILFGTEKREITIIKLKFKSQLSKINQESINPCR